MLSVVRRLDGLPLAIELAAARVRAMSVEDIDRRLDDRFALLRGGDRTAPDRHQTLLAVIDWSWNLLRDTERRALRWLSTFHDGFSLDGADAVLGHDALDDVRSLVDQSLLTVLDSGRTVRYRMLETVREFGRLQLVEAGEEAAARDAQLEWACGFALRLGDDLWSPRQVEAVREVGGRGEQPRRRPARGAHPARPVVGGAAAHGAGLVLDHPRREPRVIAVAGAADAALTGWAPTDEQVDVAVSAAAIVALNTVGGEIGGVPASLALLDAYGERTSSARVRGLVAVVQAQVLDDPAGTVARLDAIAEESDREAAAVARLWAAHHLENTGDPAGAIAQAELALTLVSDADGPWIAAMLHTMVGTLNSQLGDSEEAVRHARAALPVLDRLDAADDAAQTRALLAVHAMSVGRLDEAEEWMAEIERTRRRSSDFGGASLAAARAEMALARGRGRRGPGAVPGRGRASSRRSASRGWATPPGWSRGPCSARAWASPRSPCTAPPPTTSSRARRLYRALLAKALLVLDPQRPVHGLPRRRAGAARARRLGAAARVDAAPRPRCGSWCSPSGSATPASPRRCGPERTEPVAEERAPGLAARLRADYADRTAPSLLPEARAAIAQVPADLTSCGSRSAPPAA